MAMRAEPVLDWESIVFGIDERYNKYTRRTYRCYFDPLDSEFFVGSNLPSGIAYHTQDPGYAGFVVTSIPSGRCRGSVTLPGNALNVDGSGSAAPGAGSLGVRQWDIDVEYGPWTSLLESVDGNPLNKPATIRNESQRNRRIAVQDKAGNPILNTVGDPFDPAPELDTSTGTLHIEKNVATADLYVNIPITDPDTGERTAGWVDCVNSDQYGPFPPRSLKIAPVVFRQMNHQTCGVYYQREVPLEIAPDGTWDLVLGNLGKRVYDKSQESTGSDANGNPIYPLKAVLDGGTVADEPVFISEAGDRLEPPVDKQNIVNLVFEAYPTLNFANTFGDYATLTPTGGGAG